MQAMSANPVHRSTRRFAAVSLALAIAAAACGGSSGNSLPSAESGIEGVPVPVSTVLDYSEAGARVFLATNMSYAEVTDWYASMMPIGRDFNDWAWCASTSGSQVDYYENTWRIYRRGELGVLLVLLYGYTSGVEIQVITGTTSDLGSDFESALRRVGLSPSDC